MADLVAATAARLAASRHPLSAAAADAAAATGDAAAGAPPPPAVRIYGGFATGDDPTVAPVMVRLLGAGPGGSPRLRCAGTLVSRSSVLTAAACGVRRGDVLGIASARLGGGFFFPVTRVVVHPDYRPVGAAAVPVLPPAQRVGPPSPAAAADGAAGGGSGGINGSDSAVSARQAAEPAPLDVPLSTSSTPPQVGLARATAANLAVVHFTMPAYVDWRVARAANFHTALLVVGRGQGTDSGVAGFEGGGGVGSSTAGTAAAAPGGGGTNETAPAAPGGGGINITAPAAPGGGGVNGTASAAPASRDGPSIFDVVGAIAGWGRVTVAKDVAPQLVDSLRATTIRRWDDADCDAAFRAAGGSRPSDTFCAGSVGRGTCQGDVGGPFGIIGGGERFAISAVSAGYFESDRFRCEPRGPAYFTSLTPHLEWLRSAVAPEKVKLFEGLK